MIYKTYHCKDIPRGELHQSLEAKKTENKVKNRYTTIYPCMYFFPLIMLSPSYY